MKTQISPALAPSHTVPSPRRRPLASGLSLPFPGGAVRIGFAATFGIAPGALAGIFAAAPRRLVPVPAGTARPLRGGGIRP